MQRPPRNSGTTHLDSIDTLPDGVKLKRATITVTSCARQASGRQDDGDKLRNTECWAQQRYQNGADKLHEPDGGVDVDAKRLMQSGTTLWARYRQTPHINVGKLCQCRPQTEKFNTNGSHHENKSHMCDKAELRSSAHQKQHC